MNNIVNGEKLVKEPLYRIKRTIEKNINSTIFKYSNNRYAIAFRKRSDQALYEDCPSNDNFFLIKNSIRFWRADPFLFKHKGTNYLFAELYDKRKSKGVLAYARLHGKHCSKFKVCLEESYHLSYPCVFQCGNDIYMIPETKDNGKVTLYRAVSFPQKWERYKEICDLPCVDTTPFVTNNEYYYFTTIASDKSSDDNLHLISEKDGSIRQLLSDNLCSRSAGNVLKLGDVLIRPSQDDTTYGDAVVLNKVNSLADDYSETSFRRILPPGSITEDTDFCVSVEGYSKGEFDGLHTYNVNEDYEVIDLRYPRRKRKR